MNFFEKKLKAALVLMVQRRSLLTGGLLTMASTFIPRKAFSTITELLNLESPNFIDDNKEIFVLSMLKALRFILPKRYRESFAGDLHEMYHALINEDVPTVLRWLILLGNISNVFWSAFRFRYDEYFGKESSTEKK